MLRCSLFFYGEGRDALRRFAGTVRNQVMEILHFPIIFSRAKSVSRHRLRLHQTFLCLQDFIITVSFAFLWLVCSSAWAHGINGVKTATDPTVLAHRLGRSNDDNPSCSSCEAGRSPNYANLNISVVRLVLIFPYLNGTFCWSLGPAAQMGMSEASVWSSVQKESSGRFIVEFKSTCGYLHFVPFCAVR